MYVKIIFANDRSETLHECETVSWRVSGGSGDFDDPDRPHNFLDVTIEKPHGTITVWLEKGELQERFVEDHGPRKHQIYVMNETGKTIESFYW